MEREEVPILNLGAAYSSHVTMDSSWLEHQQQFVMRQENGVPRLRLVRVSKSAYCHQCLIALYFAVRMCAEPDIPTNGQIDVTSGRIYGSEVKYSCDEGYYLNGSSLRKCAINEEWNRRQPSCQGIGLPFLSNAIA